MHNNFYIKFNYRNIIPFNLKKKKLRIHSNLIANKGTAAQGYFFGVKIKFWYYYFSINGLKKDNTILIKNFSNKKLSVFFISNFNMIEGKWMFPKIYEEYYAKFSFLKKRKINIIRLKLFFKNNFNNFFSSLNCKGKNNKNLYYFYNISYKQNKIYSNTNYNNKFKFIITNKLPLIYYYNKKKVKVKFKKSVKPNFFIIKKFINILQFVKIFINLKKFKYKNILSLLYNFFLYFKFIKMFNIKYNIYKIIKLLFNNFNKKLYKKKWINNICLLRYNIKKLYNNKIYYNKYIDFKNFTFWKLNKKKKIYFNNYWLYFNNFNIWNKNNILFYLRNKKIKRRKNLYSFLKKKNRNRYRLHYLKKYSLYDQWLKFYLLKLLNNKNNKNH